MYIIITVITIITIIIIIITTISSSSSSSSSSHMIGHALQTLATRDRSHLDISLRSDSNTREPPRRKTATENMQMHSPSSSRVLHTRTNDYVFPNEINHTADQTKKRPTLGGALRVDARAARAAAQEGGVPERLQNVADLLFNDWLSLFSTKRKTVNNKAQSRACKILRMLLNVEINNKEREICYKLSGC